MSTIRKSASLAGWLRAWGPWVALNAAAASLMIYVWMAGGREMFETAASPFHPGLESGKWAVRWLLICLAMSPLNAYLGWRGAVRLRKPAGLWAFAFASAHFLSYWLDNPLTNWLRPDISGFLVLGLVGLLILAALAATSNKRAKRALGQRWKRLHRWVYVAGGAIGLHAVLAMDNSKLIWARDGEALPELQLYLTIFIALMLLRVPAVKQAIKAAGRGGRRPADGVRALRLGEPEAGG